MLRWNLMPENAGIELWGMGEDLNRLGSFVHRVIEKSVFITNPESFVIGLAYDVRKARDGMRFKEEVHFEEERSYPVYGVEILWPVLLIQVGALRHGMAFMPTTKLDQAIMFELEAVVDAALQEAIPAQAEEILHTTEMVSSGPFEHLEEVADSRFEFFDNLPKKKRLSMLNKIMQTLDPMYGYFSKMDFFKHLGLIPPDAFSKPDE